MIANGKSSKDFRPETTQMNLTRVEVVMMRKRILKMLIITKRTFSIRRIFISIDPFFTSMVKITTRLF